MTTTVSLLAANARVEWQNGWLWVVVLAIIVVLAFFVAAGWLRYRWGNRTPPPPPHDFGL